MRANAKSTGSEHTTVLDICLGTLLVQDIQQYTILSLAGYDNHILEVLGTSTDQRDTTNINLLNDVSLRSTTGYSLLKGVLNVN